MQKRLFLNGHIHTMDETCPLAQAMAVEGEKLVFVGSNVETEAFAKQRFGQRYKVFQLGGRTLVPGFADNHTHAVMFGWQLINPDLTGLNEQQIVEVLRQAYPNPPPGQMLMAFNWDYPSCPRPRKELIDQYFPNNPVVLSQFSGHAWWLNSVALKILKIGKPGMGSGIIDRNPNGEPTGVVADMNNTEITRRRHHTMYFLKENRERCLFLALDQFRANGITSIHDNTWYYPCLASMTRACDQGRLSCRVNTWSLGKKAWTTPTMRAMYGLGFGRKNWVQRGPIKHFLDGAFSTYTACLSEPYTNGGQGYCVDMDLPERELERLGKNHGQGAFHAIGDQAVSYFLDAFEKASARYPNLLQQRMRIEHAQLIKPADIERIQRFNLCIASQPSAVGTPAKDIEILGPLRAKRAYPFKSLLNAGVHLSFGSDIPGELQFKPLELIHMAVNRESQEALTVQEALRCYTVESAYAEHMEESKGRLKPGYLADFTVLSEDLFTIHAHKIKDIKVMATYVGGRRTYAAPDDGASGAP